MLATLDIGNSRLKAALWQRGEIVAVAAADYDRLGETMPQQISDFVRAPLFTGNAVERILAACVAGEPVEQALTAVALQAGLPVVEFFRSSVQCCGITHAYADPAQHGVDRWAALIGARKLHAGPLCIVSVGTAVTVDLLGADNVHLGGRIMPGLGMMQAALRQTAGVRQVDGEPVIFARTTADAVCSGVHSMLQAGIRQAMADARRLLGDNMHTFLTGGQAGLIHDALHRQRQVDMAAVSQQPHLVMHGLQTAAEQG